MEENIKVAVKVGMKRIATAVTENLLETIWQ